MARRIHPARRYGRKLRAFCLLAFCLLAAGSSASGAAGEELRLDHLERIGVEDGLAHSRVWDVHQDSRGFLWIATESYLQRFDGYDFKAYKHDPTDDETLSESQVMTIFEDSAGRLWFGTRNTGVNRWERAEGRFTRFLPDPDDRHRLTPGLVLAIAEDLDGALWIGTSEGLNHLDPVTGAVTRHRHDPADPGTPAHDGTLGVLVTSAGELWIGNLAGLERYDRATGTFVRYRHDPGDPGSLSSDEFGSFFEDREGTLWVGGWDGVLHRYDRERDAFVRLDPEAGEGSGIRVIREDAVGDLWLGTEAGGLIRYRREDGTFACARHDPNDPHTPSSDEIFDLHEDRAGVLWIATEAGLDKQVRQRERFSVLRHRPGSDRGLPGGHVLALAEDSAGIWWIGTLENGLAAYDPAERSFVHLRPEGEGAGELLRGTIKAVLEDRTGTVWVGSSNGLGRLERSRRGAAGGRVVPVPGVTAPVVDLFEDSSGVLWVVTGGGLYRLGPERSAVEHFAHDPAVMGSAAANRLYDVVEDPAGFLWLASEGGLQRFDPATGTFERIRHDPRDPESPGSDNLVTLHRDAGGNLWIGSYGGGLDRWHPDDGWRHYRERDGLPSNKVVAVLEAGDGELWLATNGGLSRFDPENESFRNYDAGDGLHGDVFYIGAALFTSTGELAFGGPGGVTFFDPARIVDDPRPPPVVLTELRLLDEPAPLARRSPGSPLVRAIGELDELVLDHRHRTFSLEFAALAFADPRKNRYAYRLAGYDHGWIETDSRHRFARYTNLDPGEYRFEVRGTNQDGVWSEPPMALGVIVRPPPWRSWWAWGLYGCAAVAAAAGLLRWQQLRIERERAESARLREIDRLREELMAQKTSQLKVLRGLLPICSSCKKIRDDEGYWREVESFLDSHSEAELSHGLCPGCARSEYGDLLARRAPSRS